MLMRIALSGSVGVVVALAVGAATTGGCATAEYRGASPSARTMTDSPRDLRDYYVGMNFQFALDRPGDYRPAPQDTPTTAPTSTGSASTD